VPSSIANSPCSCRQLPASQQPDPYFLPGLHALIMEAVWGDFQAIACDHHLGAAFKSLGWVANHDVPDGSLTEMAVQVMDWLPDEKRASIKVTLASLCQLLQVADSRHVVFTVAKEIYAIKVLRLVANIAIMFGITILEFKNQNFSSPYKITNS
jgi:hypothetical protein